MRVLCLVLFKFKALSHLAKTPSDVDPEIRYVSVTKDPAKAMVVSIVRSDRFVLPPI